MTDPPTPKEGVPRPYEGYGSTRVREHCTFEWTEHGAMRMVEVKPEHCARCLEELQQFAAHHGLVLRMYTGGTDP